MITHPYKIDGENVVVRVLETVEDIREFDDWIQGCLRLGMVFGLDSETTGLDTYSDGNRLRTVQVGTEFGGWVIPVERSAQFKSVARNLLNQPATFILHNASFDLQVFERHLGVRMDDMWPKVADTRILAHLVDPRGQDEGGTGHSLEALTSKYIDSQVAEEIKRSMTKLAKELKVTKDKLWKLPELTQHPKFQLYAGMDPILAIRLYEKLYPLIPDRSKSLLQFEHKIAEVCSELERNGFLLDTVYTEDLSAKLQAEEEEASNHALWFFGIESVNSTDQVADALEDLGIKIKERTPTGKRKVDSKLLDSLIVPDPEIGSAAHLAAAVTEAKKARKWRTTWVDGFLDGSDSNDRVHPSINPLRARTARMSITGIPAQTLPSGDWMVRRCFIADERQSIVSVDYQAQELRVLAALSKDKTMTQAFQCGADLHLITAQAAFGPHITKDSPERKYAKVVNFGRVYGGGARTVAEQTGLSFPQAKKVVEGFDKSYPGVTVYSQKLQKQAERDGYLYTPTGRRLPVDKDRAYSALNYMVQSTSRDVTCRGLLRLHEAGFTPYLRLPVHDEVVASLPTNQAEWGAKQIAELMRMDMDGVDIATDAEVGGRSWGSLYGADY